MTETAATDDDEQWSADRIAQLKCERREDGKWTHLFVDYSNKCQCGEKDLNSYRDLVLR